MAAAQVNKRKRPYGKAINLSHGSGGKAMRDLVEGLILPALGCELNSPLEDQARLPISLWESGGHMAFTTDSYVVDPLFFPGGDIGSLAINGTVNDLAVGGAEPLFLSCGLILEEGLLFTTLESVLSSMAQAARSAGVTIVTGDTKVVPRGGADKLFINTAGIGRIPAGRQLSLMAIQPGDRLLLNGYLGDHGAAILQARGDLALEAEIQSDCQPLHTVIAKLLTAAPNTRCLRDLTRGGLGTVLNEFAEGAGVSIRIHEDAIPVRPVVRGICELLGLDPLYLANEGKLLAVVPENEIEGALAALRRDPAGEQAAIIGEVLPGPAGRVRLRSHFGGERLVDMLVGEQLPRIC
ncbi:hydrogenase expression/formation protein HypE [Acidithiobacillus ferrooxidans]|uniref:hydrogenase expression/formation protein HypE n=1 Tax=Acidithiobacillus ferrooxidans TaxID=920 RepID=UPI002148FC9A|nr:hydrogenase expression/formation protein HypE [Acidithiobacillus ferrooxidans]MCR1347467.1 hydrogenase expression/formation protein HypE [Acidithiobacillus ferrooxidans]MCR1355380.1 hydrogenase expression/formation protein HypE [Acidithiobacillus ferrooxidans]